MKCFYEKYLFNLSMCTSDKRSFHFLFDFQILSMEVRKKSHSSQSSQHRRKLLLFQCFNFLKKVNIFSFSIFSISIFFSHVFVLPLLLPMCLQYPEISSVSISYL